MFRIGKRNGIPQSKNTIFSFICYLPLTLPLAQYEIQQNSKETEKKEMKHITTRETNINS